MKARRQEDMTIVCSLRNHNQQESESSYFNFT